MTYRQYKNEETRSSVLSGIADSANQKGWARFFDLYAGYVFGIARNRGLAEQDADEIVQEVMNELARGDALRQYDRNKGSFRSWLCRRVLWRVADWARREKKRMDAIVLASSDMGCVPDCEPSQLEREFEAEWLEAVMAEALRRLKEEVNERHYAIFHAAAIECLDTTAIQKIYAVSADNIYQIRRRVSMRFRKIADEVSTDLDNPTIK